MAGRLCKASTAVRVDYRCVVPRISPYGYRLLFAVSPKCADRTVRHCGSRRAFPAAPAGGYSRARDGGFAPLFEPCDQVQRKRDPAVGVAMDSLLFCPL